MTAEEQKMREYFKRVFPEFDIDILSPIEYEALLRGFIVGIEAGKREAGRNLGSGA